MCCRLGSVENFTASPEIVLGLLFWKGKRNVKEKKRNGLARAALLAATLIWGSSFIIVKDVVDTVPTCLLLAIRFLSASLILAAVFRKRMRGLNRSYLWQGGVLGLLLFAAYALQTLGITETTPGKNAFLTAVYCVLVPFLYWIVGKKRPDRYNIAAALLCITGIGLVSLTSDFSIGRGDILTLCGGFFYAAHIIAVCRFSDGRDPVLLTVVQFASSGLLALVGTLLFEDRGGIVWNRQLLLGIGYLAVFCTAAALLMQNFGQKYTPPATASILLSLESVFGVAFSVALYGERLTLRIVAGYLLIFCAVLLSETKLAFLKRRGKPHAALKDARLTGEEIGEA